ncbi:hypothetical protein HanRHA438_Chr16g0776621 [Helianthus annuus]|nr:hypothetical protein HanRHA438_Chr16g0776621 [Helianthus annuus]
MAMKHSATTTCLPLENIHFDHLPINSGDSDVNGDEAFCHRCNSCNFLCYFRLSPTESLTVLNLFSLCFHCIHY